MTSFAPSILRARASLLAAGFATLLGGCVIEAKIGDDPESGNEATTHGETEWPPPEETTTTGFPGYTSGVEPGSTTTSSTSIGGTAEDDGATITAGMEPGLDQDAALELCGVEVAPPVPGQPLYFESLSCAGGCEVYIETSVLVGLVENYGDCLCQAMGCAADGDSTFGQVTIAPGETDGDPDGCGPFPDGDAGFTCTCEMCSIDVTNVDPAWLEGEADLEVICECMCGGAGCGSPI